MLLCEPILAQQHVDKPDHDQAMFKPSLCESILTQRAPDQLNRLIPTNRTVSM